MRNVLWQDFSLHKGWWNYGSQENFKGFISSVCINIEIKLWTSEPKRKKPKQQNGIRWIYIIKLPFSLHSQVSSLLHPCTHASSHRGRLQGVRFRPDGLMENCSNSFARSLDVGMLTWPWGLSWWPKNHGLLWARNGWELSLGRFSGMGATVRLHC